MIEMDIKERVIGNAARWIALVDKGEITWEQVSLLVNAFELGMAEMASETGATHLGYEACKYTQDVNQYIKNKSGSKNNIPFCMDVDAVDLIKTDLQSTLNFRSRRICADVKNKCDLLTPTD